LQILVGATLVVAQNNNDNENGQPQGIAPTGKTEKFVLFLICTFIPGYLGFFNRKFFVKHLQLIIVFLK